MIAADIKSTFSPAITDLKSNLLALNEKMAVAETVGNKAICRLERVSVTQNHHFIEMNRHSEDLDNRGRRNNIHVRGIPETVEPAQIITALQQVFNSLLERQEDMVVEFVRGHRALNRRDLTMLPHET